MFVGKTLFPQCVVQQNVFRQSVFWQNVRAQVLCLESLNCSCSGPLSELSTYRGYHGPRGSYLVLGSLYWCFRGMYYVHLWKLWAYRSMTTSKYSFVGKSLLKSTRRVFHGCFRMLAGFKWIWSFGLPDMDRLSISENHVFSLSRIVVFSMPIYVWSAKSII